MFMGHVHVQLMLLGSDQINFIYLCTWETFAFLSMFGESLWFSVNFPHQFSLSQPYFHAPSVFLSDMSNLERPIKCPFFVDSMAVVIILFRLIFPFGNCCCFCVIGMFLFGRFFKNFRGFVVHKACLLMRCKFIQCRETDWAKSSRCK